MALEFLTPIFAPLFWLGTLPGIVIISLLCAVILTAIHKYTTNQSLLKQAKDQMDVLRKNITTVPTNEERLKVRTELLQKSMEYNKLSFRAAPFTLIPMIFIFGWMSSHLAFEPLTAGEPFTLTLEFEPSAAGTVRLLPHDALQPQGETEKKAAEKLFFEIMPLREGSFIQDFSYEGKTFAKEIAVGEHSYSEQTKTFDNEFKSISISYNKLTPLGEFSIGSWKPGWLAISIISQLFFGMALRKMLKVY